MYQERNLKETIFFKIDSLITHIWGINGWGCQIGNTKPIMDGKKELLTLEQIFPGKSEMACRLRAMDWSQSAMGPVDTWSQSLKTVLGMCLASKFPTCVWWGKNFSVFYNDDYIPIASKKHPQFIGRSAQEKWSEIWHALQPITDKVFATGEAYWAEGMQFFMSRNDFLEETYFTFSYTPIWDESGNIAGVVIPCQEKTQQIISERRFNILNNLGTLNVSNATELAQKTIQVLKANLNDIPIAQFYLINKEHYPHLIEGYGWSEENMVDPIWPFNEVIQTKSPKLVTNLRKQFPQAIPKLPYEEGPDAIYMLPLNISNSESLSGVLVLGVSSRLEFEKSYENFFCLIGKHISSHLSNVYALEKERLMVESLAAVDQAKTAFFNNISHEFRTPLTLMISPLEDMLKEPLPSETKNNLEMIHRSGMRLLRLVNMLLDFARIESNHMQPTFDAVDLAAYTQDLASVFRSAIEKAGITFIVNCSPLKDPVFVDREMWEKIIMNLLSNALKFTFKGEIAVTLKQIGQHAVLTVSDTGHGIPEKELPHMFDRFHRIANMKSRTHEGTGIGLAFVKELVSYHEGYISVTSTLGVGSTFKIQIPLGDHHIPKDQIRTNSSYTPNKALSHQFIDEALNGLPEENSNTSQSKLSINVDTHTSPLSSSLQVTSARILLADDNHDMRSYLKKLMSPYWIVDIAEDGQQALELAIANPPDLLLTDIMMPRMDGVQLLKQLRSHDKTKNIPVILLSARAGEESRIEGIEMGADDYLIKPFSAKELLARVKTHLHLSLKRQETSQLLALINQKLQNLNSELEEKVHTRTEELVQEKLKLEKTNEELNQYATIAAHDLRAPVRTIQSWIELLSISLAPQREKEVQDAIRFIQQSAIKLDSLIVNLLKVARVGTSSLENTEVDLNQILESVKKNRFAEIEKTQAKIHWSALPSVIGNTSLLEALFSNLIGNAINYRELTRIPDIVIDCKETEKYFEFSIKDNGIGIEEAYVNRVFEMFKRLHSDHDRPGTGVGLAYCKKIVEGYGGEIWIKSIVNSGTTIYFTYPKNLTTRSQT